MTAEGILKVKFEILYIIPQKLNRNNQVHEPKLMKYGQRLISEF